MTRENIFIHIPKTGGTTINTSIEGTYWGTEPNFYYRHLVLKTKRSNSADIFNPLNYDKYKDYNIFMMLREPIDRMISEYYFLRERKNFMDLLRSQPRSFSEYIKNIQTQNYMVGFLVGKRIFDNSPATEDDLDLVINTIDSLPIHIGIFEHYQESLLYFQKLTGIKWKKKIEVKRITFNRPKKEELLNEIQDLILDKNYLDKKLYDHCLEIFNSKKGNIPKGKITFIKDKYNHILPYTIGICLFEFCMENKRYLRQNISYFKNLTFYLHKNMRVTDGRTFVKIWNETFVNSFKSSFPASALLEKIETAYDKKSEPLDQTINIAKAMDDFFSDTTNKTINKYYKTLVFNPSLVRKPKSEKAGFLKSIFSFNSN